MREIKTQRNVILQVSIGLAISARVSQDSVLLNDVGWYFLFLNKSIDLQGTLLCASPLKQTVSWKHLLKDFGDFNRRQ